MTATPGASINKSVISDRHDPAARISQQWPTRQISPNASGGILKHILRVMGISAQSMKHGHQRRAMSVEQMRELSLQLPICHSAAPHAMFASCGRQSGNAARSTSMTGQAAKVFALVLFFEACWREWRF
jgi:hypothetical protein